MGDNSDADLVEAYTDGHEKPDDPETLPDRLLATYQRGPFGARQFSPYVPRIQKEASHEIRRLRAKLAAIERQGEDSTEYVLAQILADARESADALAEAVVKLVDDIEKCADLVDADTTPERMTMFLFGLGVRARAALATYRKLG